MVNKHTPGPWLIDIESERQWDICVDRGDDLWVVVQMTQSVGSAVLDAEDKANAILIAAAPELLNELRECRDFLMCVETCSRNNFENLAAERLDAINAIVAKATGQE